MKINHLRASTINSYKICEFSFFIQYVCEVQLLSNSKADLGSVCHLVFEILAKSKKTGHYKLKDKYSDPDYLLKIVFNRYKNKISIHHNWGEDEYKFCKKTIDLVLKTNLNPLSLDIFATESQFEIELQKPGFYYNYISDLTGEKESGYCKLRGTIDLLHLEDEFTVHCQDYKTGIRKDILTGKNKDTEDFEKEIQFLVYHLAINTIFPEFKYHIFTMLFMNDGGPFTVSFSYDEIYKTIDKLRRIFNEISSNNNPKRLKDDPTQKHRHFWCKFVCPLGSKYPEKDGQTKCDKYYKILQQEGIEKASKKIYNLSIEGKSMQDVSRRNDYNRAGINRSILQ